MDKLTSALRRLYLLGDQPYDVQSPAMDLVNDDGMQRTLVIDFHKATGEEHWVRLCDVANALQTELALPAPAVSVSGGESYRLWLSLAKPVSAEQAWQFLSLLHQAYFADEAIDLGRSRVDLPPALNHATGLWSAFINPSMGGALAEDLGLEMSPPLAAQAAFLDGLLGISEEQFAQAFDRLQRRLDASLASASAATAATTAVATAAATSAPPAPSAPAATPRAASGASQDQGRLLKDATLEEIVQHLHALGIEPTFRHLLKN